MTSTTVPGRRIDPSAIRRVAGAVLMLGAAALVVWLIATAIAQAGLQ